MSEQEQSSGIFAEPTTTTTTTAAATTAETEIANVQQQNQLNSDSQQTTLANGLTQAQQESVDRARAYAHELQQTVFKDLLETERKLKEEESKLPAGTVNPGLLSGMDPRNASVMSRLYVGSINFDLTEEHIRRVFSEFGTVRSVSMSKDPMSGRHKGFGFVEYEVPEAASLAMDAMNGTMLGGRQLKIGRPNNYNVAVAQGFEQPPMERIYVANVNEAIGEDSLREIFAPFGDVSACVLAPDMSTRKHKGWGFIEFADQAAADQAAIAMNGFSLGNLVLRVRKCVVGGPLGDGMAALDTLPLDTTEPPNTAQQPPPAVRPPQQVMDVVASINKNIIGATEPIAGPQPPPAVEGSSIVLLENVVGGRAEVDDELAGDMAGEGTKCGAIEKVVVHIASPQELAESSGVSSEVSIFIQYIEPASAANAIELFDGRWFGGRRISATLYDSDMYRMVTSADTMVFIP
ncbi:hypothetical protein IW140_006027 [Coemansia sp. RSA 1813]|nr:hypothetical protein LPJ74_005966 [Coemansia sp. RSA 1843]KAJ2085995.1 hypothetical protein IW138_005981 [Coemansia sp. RSA 986]KAJ2215016.1 hypothetical protein EV179_002546 [Coemansia sp. RSA 487]KAJ2563656.1 hypothetical protein IW140_006027 [Coemansia sp. RSA 1813]